MNETVDLHTEIHSPVHFEFFRRVMYDLISLSIVVCALVWTIREVVLEVRAIWLISKDARVKRVPDKTNQPPDKLSGSTTDADEPGSTPAASLAALPPATAPDSPRRTPTGIRRRAFQPTPSVGPGLAYYPPPAHTGLPTYESISTAPDGQVGPRVVRYPYTSLPDAATTAASASASASDPYGSAEGNTTARTSDHDD